MKTYCCDFEAVGEMVDLDLDKDGRVIGIEILDARSRLPPYVLAAAERLDA